MVQVQIAMMACDRQPKRNYSADSLASLFSADPSAEQCNVSVVVDGADDAFLGSWREDKRVRVTLLNDAEVAERSTWQLNRRISDTCLRALKTAAQGSALVFCQDDVEFAPGWLQATMAAVRAATARNAGRVRGGRLRDEDFAIALYTTRKVLQRPIAYYPAQYFFGSQALYFPAPMTERLVAYFEKHYGERRMDDMLMKDFFWHNNVALWAINPNVVQHVGVETTHDGSFHRSPTYGRR